MAFSADDICSPRARRYAFWSLIALLAALTVHDVYVLVDEYMENPKKVDMVVIFNETITFPNITICGAMLQFRAPFAPNATMQKTWDADLEKELKTLKTKKLFMQKDWGLQVTAEAMMVVMALTSLEVEVENVKVPMNLHQLPRNPRLFGKNKMINEWLKRIEDLDVSYHEFYQKTGEEILRRSLHQMRRISLDEDDVFPIRPKIMWISQNFFCFQPTFTKDEPIKSQGQFLLAQFKLDLAKLEGHDLECMRGLHDLHAGAQMPGIQISGSGMRADFHGRPSDFIRDMDGPAGKRDGFAEDFCPGQYVEVRVEVKTVFDMLPNDTPGRECDELSAEGKNNYDCKLNCRIEYIRSLCNCTPVSLAYLVENEADLTTYPLCNYSKCTIDAQSIDLQMEPACVKQCKRDCHQVRYTVTNSNAKKTLALTNKHKSILSRDIITVSFMWGSFEYIGLEEDWKYSSVQFISELGGAIGVYLGLSVLTFVVGLVYGFDMGYHYLNGYWSSSSQKQGGASAKNSEAAAPQKDEVSESPAVNGNVEK